MKNAKNEKPWAHTLSKTHFGKNSGKRPVSEHTFSEVISGHRKPETGNQNKKMGPRRFEFWDKLIPLQTYGCLRKHTYVLEVAI